MSEKTEQPTAKKLRDARKKGQVAKSKEVSSAFTISVALLVLFAMMPWIVDQLHDSFLLPTKFYTSEFEFSANVVAEEVIRIAISIIVPIIAAVVVAGVIGNLIQTGVLFTGTPIQPKLSNLNPGAAAKRIFGIKNLVEFLKSIVKIIFLSVLLILVIRDSLNELIKLPICGVSCIPLVLGRILWQISVYTIGAFVLIASADYVFQRWQFMNEQKMTKDEVKREYKESEGDPHIKGKRKQMAQEIAMAQTEEKVRNSAVVVTNPTHIAVALQYEHGETPLPIVAATGEGFRAHHIVRIAKKAGVPIMQNVPLARGLYSAGTVNQYIPAEFIEPIVEVLLWVRSLEEGDGEETDT